MLYFLDIKKSVDPPIEEEIIKPTKPFNNIK